MRELLMLRESASRVFLAGEKTLKREILTNRMPSLLSEPLLSLSLYFYIGTRLGYDMLPFLLAPVCRAPLKKSSLFSPTKTTAATAATYSRHSQLYVRYTMGERSVWPGTIRPTPLSYPTPEGKEDQYLLLYSRSRTS